MSNANTPKESCPDCSSVEVESRTPRTTYACGSSDYDQRPGSFTRGKDCKVPTKLLSLLQRVICAAEMHVDYTLVIAEDIMSEHPILFASNGKLQFKKPRVSGLLSVRPDVIYVQTGLSREVYETIHNHCGLNAEIQYFDPHTGDLYDE